MYCHSKPYLSSTGHPEHTWVSLGLFHTIPRQSIYQHVGQPPTTLLETNTAAVSEVRSCQTSVRILEVVKNKQGSQESRGYTPVSPHNGKYSNNFR